jgi:hypothetical protein
MARSLGRSGSGTAFYEGELWTDARGYTTGRLPVAGRLLPPLEHELRDLEAHSSGRVGRPKDGRFTVESDVPHVKVAWRISGRAADDRQEQTASKEDQQ